MTSTELMAGGTVTRREIRVIERIAEMPNTSRPLLAIIGIAALPCFGGAGMEARLALIDSQRTHTVTSIPLGSSAVGQGFLIESEGIQFTVMSYLGAFDAAPYAAAVNASLDWPTAGQALRKATGQIIVAANQPAEDHAAAVKIAYLLTVVAAAVAGLVDTAFIYWASADLLVEPAAFEAATVTMLERNEPPLLQWIRFDVFRGPHGPGGATGGMRSRGLSGFLGYELQLDPVAMAPVEIARRAVGYSEHLLREGPTEFGAEMDGPTAGERIGLLFEEGRQGPLLRMRILSAGADLP